jgi:hypothetical protein
MIIAIITIIIMTRSRKRRVAIVEGMVMEIMLVTVEVMFIAFIKTLTESSLMQKAL